MLKVRRAEMSDATSIASLVTQLGYPTGPDDMVDRLKRMLDDPRHTVLVAVADNGDVAGMGAACIDHGPELDGLYARVTGLVVDEKVRGRGVGAFLMQQIEHWAKEHGADRVTLTSGNYRPEAHKFYDAIGYSATGTRFMKRL